MLGPWSCISQPVLTTVTGRSATAAPRRAIMRRAYDDLDGEWKRRLNEFGFLYTYPGGALTCSPGAGGRASGDLMLDDMT